MFNRYYIFSIRNLSIDFFAIYFANYLINILFLFIRRDFLDLKAILIIYYREE